MTTIPTLGDLRLEEKLAQLLFVRIGSNLPPVKTVGDDAQRVAELLTHCPVGGLLFFNGEWPQSAATLNALQAQSKTPLLVGADLERGAGQQIKGLTVFPHAAAFEQCGSDAAHLVREANTVTARQARAAGIHLLFAPVADVNSNKSNPIISTRSYSATADGASRFVAAAIQGIESAGQLATAKHFPGHGDTHQDSHAELPAVDRSRSELDQLEFAPFRRAIAAGVSVVMTAHVRYPALDATGMPATFSAPILRGLLRDELGYEGAICSDSLLMAGATKLFQNEGEMAAAALTAGVDMLLDIADPVAVVNDLKRRVQAGELCESLVDQAVERILKLKTKAFASDLCQSTVSGSAPLRESDAKLASRIATQAIKVSRERVSEPILQSDGQHAVVLMKPFDLPTDPREQPIVQALRQASKRCEYWEVGPQHQPEADAEVLAAVEKADQTILAIIAKPAAWHPFGMTEAQQNIAHQIANRDNVVLVSLGDPEVLGSFSDETPKLFAFSDVPVSQEAVAEVLVRGYSAPS